MKYEGKELSEATPLTCQCCGKKSPPVAIVSIDGVACNYEPRPEKFGWRHLGAWRGWWCGCDKRKPWQ